MRRLSQLDRQMLESRVRVFADGLGLPPKIPQPSDIVDGVYAVFASLPDKIESAIDNNGKSFINFGNDKKASITKKRELEKQGYHVFWSKGEGDASGAMTFQAYRNPVQFVEVVLHEGFHNNPCNELHIMLEEPGAYCMGVYGAIEFFRIFGNDGLLAEARAKKDKTNRYAQRVLQRYEKRKEELSAGKIIPASDEYNNAALLADLADYQHYPLIRRVHEATKYLGRTRMILTGLPPDLSEGVKKLEAIASNPDKAWH